ncbi:hypothetical protein [Pseudobacteriovorax antillogorgiicola]|uniref:hypothetical protein n=1 Tax=Pseudobacteriovorax antillogorgiicola TaxID=1513793 RepID=UPI0010527A3E|nr:hypothetical protein [Pseudobacteriovorax antillogorgiicola]
MNEVFGFLGSVRIDKREQSILQTTLKAVFGYPPLPRLRLGSFAFQHFCGANFFTESAEMENKLIEI